MIRKEDVADLRAGDVVEFRIDTWAQGAAIRGPLVTNEYGMLAVPIPGDGGGYWVRDALGHVFDGDCRSLTVVSRAKPPLYVNHDRTEPVPGDVACDDEVRGDPALVWSYLGMDRSDGTWFDRWGYGITRSDLADRLRLLVDGETGQVVP